LRNLGATNDITVASVLKDMNNEKKNATMLQTVIMPGKRHVMIIVILLVMYTHTCFTDCGAS